MTNHRIDCLDLIRTLALLGMISFHLSYDLLIFGLLPPEYAQTATFYFHARIVAATFIGLAGLGLFLAHGQTIRWPSFGKRFAKIAAAAALVSLATRIAMPDSFIYFGILHAIALFSLLGLATLRLPSPITALLAIVFIAGDSYLQTPSLNADLLRFLGLSTLPAYTIDFEPIFPWFGAFLTGIALGQAGQNLRPRLAKIKLAQSLTWPGRHSLAIYLIHQPVLMGLVWAYSQING